MIMIMKASLKMLLADVLQFLLDELKKIHGNNVRLRRPKLFELVLFF